MNASVSIVVLGTVKDERSQYAVLLIVLILLMTIAAWIVWLERRDRRRKLVGRCPHCHYDLRGLPPGSLCPECGRGSTAD